MKPKVAIFISGRGSNLKAVLKSFPDLKPNVYANKECEGLKWARESGCTHEVRSLKEESDWEDLAQNLNELEISLVLLLGFMKIIPPSFLSSFKGEMVNLHPSLLPSYPGLKAIKRAFEEGAALGASLHKVTEGVDEGPIILQKEASSAKTLEEATENVHAVERKIVAEFLNSRLASS